MPDWFPSVKPDWWDTAADFARNPTRFILEIVLLALVGGILTVTRTFAGMIQEVWGMLALPWEILSDLLSWSVQPVGDWVLELPGGLEEFLRNLIESFGPVAPFIVIPLVILMLIGIQRALGSLQGTVGRYI